MRLGGLAGGGDVLLELPRRQHQARIAAEALAALGPLRDDLDLNAATGVLWLKDPALYTALVGDRGWSADRYQAWLARTLQASLLPARATRDNRARS